MRIGLIDVDGHNFPNLPLMKLSAWHKKNGDEVKWYEPLTDGFPNTPLDRVYMSKVFSFSPDYEYYINALEVVGGVRAIASRRKTAKKCLIKIGPQNYCMRLNIYTQITNCTE